MPRELKNADIDFISYVYRPANKRKFLMLKEESNMSKELIMKALKEALDEKLNPIVKRIERIEKARGINQLQNTQTVTKSSEDGVFDDLFKEFEPTKNVQKAEGPKKVYYSIEDALGIEEVEEKENEEFVAGVDFEDVHSSRLNQKFGDKNLLEWDPNYEEDKNSPKLD